MTATSPTEIKPTAPVPARARPIPPLNMLVYGVSGAGKTQLALSSVEVEALCPILVLDVERGLIGVKPSANWTAAPINSLQDAENALQSAGRYKTIVIDSLSRLTRLTVQGFASVRTQGRPNEDVQLADYGKVLTRMSVLLDTLQRSPQNVIVICGQKFTYADNSTKMNPVYREIMPDLDGGVLTRAQETADFVWCLAQTGETRQLLTLPRPIFRVKSRLLLTSGVSPKGVMEEPTMAKIYDAFTKSFK